MRACAHCFVVVHVFLTCFMHICALQNYVNLPSADFHEIREKIYKSDILFRQNNVNIGDYEADPERGGQIAFATALESRSHQDFINAAEMAATLISKGSASAHTTLGFLLAHNFTRNTFMGEDELEAKSISHYAFAASRGDTLAQAILGEHYAGKDDCNSAINYFHKSAEGSLHEMKETYIYIPDYYDYIWPEDDPYIDSVLPSLDQLQLFEYLASQGDAGAALKAAYLYLGPLPGQDMDVEMSSKYLKQAIRANISEAMVWLADLYLSGEIEGDDSQAFKLLWKAYKYGNTAANSGLARMYMEGRGNLVADPSRAEKFLKEGASKGNILSLYLIGYYYKYYLELDDEAELSWLQSSTYGHIYSGWNLASHYKWKHQESLILNYTAKTRIKHAVNYCSMALPFYRLVTLSTSWSNLFDGAYIDYLSGRKSSSLVKYLLLSDLGYSAAHVNAARILEESSVKIYENKNISSLLALRMWERTADAGLAVGYLKLGDYSYYGIGMEKDYELAVHNYNMAGILGNPQGLFNLAWMNEWGVSVPRDVEKAKELYRKISSKYSDGFWPATLAAFRLELIEFIRYKLGINLDEYVNVLQNIFLFIKRKIVDYDIYIMTFLSSVISICIYLRNAEINL